MDVVDDGGHIWPTLSWADAVQITETDNDRVFHLLTSTAVAVFARYQPSWTQEAGRPLLIGEHPLAQGRGFQATDLAGKSFTITVRPHDTATAPEIAQLYAQVRTALALMVHGAHDDPTMADRLADAWGIRPWVCAFCSAPFAHWVDARTHEQTVHPERAGSTC